MSVRFSHIGLAVTDIERSRKFYEEVFGFSFDVEIKAEGPHVARLMRLSEPCDVRAVLLVKDGFTLELLHANQPEMRPFRERVLNEPGLTHLNVRATNIAEVLEKVEEYGGTVLRETSLPEMSGPDEQAYSGATYVRDPDGQLIEVIPDVIGPGGWVPYQFR